MSDRELLEALYHRTWKAMIDKDQEELTEVHAEDFVLVHMTGTRQSRKQYINSIVDGTLNYYTEYTDQINIRMQGIDKATVTGQSRVVAAVYGGGSHAWRLQLKFTAEKRDGQWVFTFCQASTY